MLQQFRIVALSVRKASMQHAAVVIGSGMGGLAVAQVLTKHFGSVVVIDKDQPDSLMDSTCVEAWQDDTQEGPKARPGVLQVSTATAVELCNVHLCRRCVNVHPSVVFAVQPNPCSASQGGCGGSQVGRSNERWSLCLCACSCIY